MICVILVMGRDLGVRVGRLWVMGAHEGRPYGFGGRRGLGTSGRRWSGFVVVVELYLSDEFFGCGHAQVGLVLGVAALHYLHEADDDVPAVAGLFLDQAVQFGCGGGGVSPGQVFVFGVDSLEGSLDVVSSEVSLAFFESDSGEYACCGYLV